MKQESLSLAAALLLLGMAPAFACEGDDMVYVDSFDEGDSAWNYDDKHVKVEEGRLTISTNPGYITHRLNQAEVYDDADICVTMEVVKDPDKEWKANGGILFWGADYNNYYALNVLPGAAGFLVERQSRGKWLTPVQYTPNAVINKGEGATNKLRVLLVGKNAKIFINGQEVASFKGRPPKGGSLAGLTGGGSNKDQAVIAFDDFKVAVPTESVAMKQAAPMVPDASLKAARIKAAGNVSNDEPMAGCYASSGGYRLCY